MYIIFKIFALALTTILYFGLGIILFNKLIKKVKTKGFNDNNFTLSYTILLSGLILALSIFYFDTPKLLNYTFESGQHEPSQTEIFRILKNILSVTGINLIGFIFVYYISKIITMLLYNNREDIIEMQENNYTYFIINSILLICMAIIFSQIFNDISNSIIVNVASKVLP